MNAEATHAIPLPQDTGPIERKAFTIDARIAGKPWFKANVLAEVQQRGCTKVLGFHSLS